VPGSQWHCAAGGCAVAQDVGCPACTQGRLRRVRLCCRWQVCGVCGLVQDGGGVRSHSNVALTAAGLCQVWAGHVCPWHCLGGTFQGTACMRVVLLGCCGSALCGVTQQKQHCFQWDCCSCFQDELVVCSELGWCSGLVLSKLGLCAAALSVLVVHSGGCHALGRLGTGSLSSAYLQGMPLTSGQLKVGVCWGLDCAAQCGANPQCLSVQVPAGSTAVCVAAQQRP
jgi:hypothetical protein